MNQTISRRQIILCLLPVIIALALIAVIAGQNKITIDKDAVTLRTGPGLTYSRVKNQSAEEEVQIIGKRHNWYKLRTSDHQVAWAPVWRVKNQTKVASGNALSEATIVIDAGHGGNDVGAEAKTESTKARYMEKTYTLKMAKLVAQKLRAQGARVIMTRTDDSYVSLKARPKLAERYHADAFVSFHFDSSPNANEGSGLTTYYYHQGASKLLARLVNNQLNSLPLSNNGINFGDFLVIRDNTRPAILCEMGYINTTKDFKQISSASYRNQVANQVVKGLNLFCKARAGK